MTASAILQPLDCGVKIPIQNHKLSAFLYLKIEKKKKPRVSSFFPVKLFSNNFIFIFELLSIANKVFI